MLRIARILMLLMKFSVSGLLLLALACAILFLILAPDMPDTNNLFSSTRSNEIIILARDGSALAQTGTSARLVAIEKMPAHNRRFRGSMDAFQGVEGPFQACCDSRFRRIATLV